jgi:UPF0755 protein
MKKAVLALVVLVLLVALAGGGYLFSLETRAHAPGPEGDAIDFEVPKGANARSVAAQLERVGLIDDPTVFRYTVWRRGGLSLKAGKFHLQRPIAPFELALALESSPMAEDEPFIVVEGWRIADTDEALVASGRAARGEYLKAALHGAGYTAPFPLPQGSLEGYLYPETYRMPKGHIDARQLVQKQLELFTARVYEPLAEDIKASPRNLQQLVIMASMLEREEPLPSNRPLVAGILWKRIDRGFPLGVDATSRYELVSWNDRSAFLVKLRDVNDPYNSRHNKGLPPTPIGAATLSSFTAALKPTPSDFLYYLHDEKKQLHPARDAAEHEANRDKYGVH